jgi:putative inorganic carbon (HCO3(-)) transporter
MSASSSLPIAEQFRSVSPRPFLVAGIGLVLITVVLAYLSTAAFLVSAVALLLLLGLATVRWPRVMLIVLVLSPPLVDLYAGQRLLPADAQSVSRFFSEALLLVMTCALAVVAARRGTLVSALRHPVTAAIGVFLAISLLSALVNAVPPTIASAGLLFTLDAAVLFYLPRMVGFSHEERNQAMWAIAVVVTITSLLAIGQAILSPDLLGVTPVTGRSGEGTRMGSLVRDPNILGTLIGMALPFTMFSLVRQPPGRRRWLVVGAALALTLALLLTYSRGSWLGVIAGFGVVALIIDRRALVAFIAVLIVAYVTAVAMPKGILVGMFTGGFDPFATTINRLQAVPTQRDLRIKFVRNAVPIVEDHLLLGVGPGRYGGAAASIFGSPIHDEYRTNALLTQQETVDNFWLHLGVEGGVLGTAAFLGLLGTAAYGPIRALRNASGSRFSVPAGVVSATAVVCVATVTTMLLEGNTAAFMFWFILGLGSMTWPAELRTADPPGSATASAG